MKARLGAIEAGGTKFVCAIGDRAGNLEAECTIPTRGPQETLSEVINFFKGAEAESRIEAWGVGSFGPIDARQNSPTYGYITSTPKLGWQNVNIVGAIQEAFSRPVGFATDVAAAALGEYTFGGHGLIEHLLYITVGTGIGGASVVNGCWLPGLGHQELGHMLLPHELENDFFEGVCPYHGRCLEGVASGVAIEQRWKTKADELPEDHTAWDLQAQYLASAVMNVVLHLSPDKIILGGGVMQQQHLFPKIRQKVIEKMNQYVHLPDVENYVIAPSLGNRAGVLGALVLADKSLNSSS